MCSKAQRMDFYRDETDRLSRKLTKLDAVGAARIETAVVAKNLTHTAKLTDHIKDTADKDQSDLSRMLDTLKTLGSADGQAQVLRGALNEEISSLQRKLANVKGEMNKKQEQMLFKQQKVQEMKRKVAEKENELTRKEEMEMNCHKYSTQLGYDVIATGSDTYVFQFTNLDRLNPQSQFVCEVKTSYNEGDKEFTVLRSVPKLDLDGLEKVLNETRDLRGFVCALRKKFKSTLA